MVGGATKVVGVIGDPIEHSLSPKMHNAAFEYLGLDYIYVPFRVLEKDLKNAVRGAKALNLRGFNVTIPHKISIIKFLDEVDLTARKIGAVNTVVNYGGKLMGYNTDGLGALEALKEENVDPEGKKIVIIGAGGAARAITFQFASVCSKLVILNRTGIKAVRLAKELTNFGVEVEGGSLTLKSLESSLSESDILINTSSVGMYPNVNESPVPKDFLRKDLVVFDIVYNPLETMLLKYARSVGAKSINGVGMLVNQGAIGFKMWTGHEAPRDIMRKAVIEGLRGGDLSVEG
ncbi:MAG: shikimate dehydrogenase [Candidatus Jordarchaeaceae archaeon]